MNSPITEEQIRKFAAAWFLALDVHAPTEECVKFLADSELKMIFPEKTLYGISDFKAWYAGGTYSDGTRAPGVANIFFDETHILQSVQPQIYADQANVRVVVGWQASWIEQEQASLSGGHPAVGLAAVGQKLPRTGDPSVCGDRRTVQVRARFCTTVAWCSYSNLHLNSKRRL